MKQTVEGIQRGHLLTGPLEPGGTKYLWVVMRVLGQHSVSVMANIGALTVELPTLNTNGIHSDDHDWKKVIYREEGLRRDSPNFGGLVIDNSYMRKHGERHPGDA